MGTPSVESSGGIVDEAPKLAIRACDHDDIAVWLTKPEFQMVGQWIDGQGFQYLGSRVNRTLVVLFDLLGHEPQRGATSARLAVGAAKVRVLVRIPVVQLQYQLTV